MNNIMTRLYISYSSEISMEESMESLHGGIIERLDGIVSMRGEEVAVMSAATAHPQPVEEIDMENIRRRCSSAGESDGESSESHSKNGSDFEPESIAPDGITYMELQFSYQSVAAQLRYRYGVRPGDSVLICCKGNAAAEIVAMLACIKLHAAFVPVDASWIGAGTRLQDILDDARPIAAIVVAEDDSDKAVVALANAELYRCLYLSPMGDIVESFNTLKDDNGFSVETFSLDNGDDSVPGTPTGESNSRDNNQHYGNSAQPIYLLYTSGSTGRPKGVRGTESGLLNRIAWQWATFPFSPGEVVFRRTPLIFVDAIAEIFSALLSLTPLWCPPVEQLAAEGIGGIAEDAHEADVSRITLLPSQLMQALKLHPDLGEKWQSLKTVFVSGEECPWALLQQVRERLSAVSLINLYGSTEVAGDVTFAILYAGTNASENIQAMALLDLDSSGGSDSVLVPVGKSIDGNYLFIFDHSGEAGSSCETVKLLADGEIGELMVVGKHLALGYHNSEASGNAKFISNPLRIIPALKADPACAFESAFLTGDLAYRCAKSGNFYLCGRKDRQVKVRGVRVELEDVERQACASLGVTEGVVALLINASTEMSSAGGNILALVLDSSILNDTPYSCVDSARRHLQDTLPSTIVPAVVLAVPELPRTTAGKLDRAGLQTQVEQIIVSTTASNEVDNAVARSTTTELTSLVDMSYSDAVDEIMRVYCSVLGVTVPSESAESFDFFSLGGDSVRMIEVLWRLRQWTGVTIKPNDLHQSVRVLVQQLKDMLTPKDIVRNMDQLQSSKRTKLIHSEDAIPEPGILSYSTYPLPISGLIKVSVTEGDDSISVGRTQADILVCEKERLHGTDIADSKGLSVKWSSKLSKCIDASPLLVSWVPPQISERGRSDGYGRSLVIVGSHGGDVVAVHARTGQLAWSLNLGEHIEAAIVLDPASGCVIINSFSGRDVDGFVSRRPGQSERDDSKQGCVWAVNAHNGEVKWHFCTQGEIKSAALVVDKCVFVGAYDGYFYQLSGQDGSLVQKYQCGGSVYASPVLTAGAAGGCLVLVACTTGKITLFAIDENCALSLVSATQMTPVFSTPLCCMLPSGSSAVIASTDGSIYALSLSSGLSHVWSAEIASTSFFSSPCLVQTSDPAQPMCAIIGCHDGKLRKVSVLDGSELWECYLGVAVFSSAFLLNGGNECVIATVAGDVIVVGTASGDVRATLKLPAEVFSSPVCCGDLVYVGCRDDRLYCVSISR